MYPRLFELGPITVYTYGVLLAAAYLLGLRLAMVRAEKRGLDHNRVLDLGIYIIISALIGAKLLLLVTDFRTFETDPRELLTLARSGGVFYGGLILAVVVALWYIRRVGLPLWTTCDVFAPGIALGHVVGRFGCFFAGCCYGIPTTIPWDRSPPPSSFRSSSPRSRWSCWSIWRAKRRRRQRAPAGKPHDADGRGG